MDGDSTGTRGGAPPEISLHGQLQTVAGTAGLVAGVLYAVGALVRLADLRGAGVNIADAFPLIPMEQHLARGVQVILQPAGLLLLALLVATGFVVNALSDRRREEEAETGRPSGVTGWLRRHLAVGLAVVGGAYLALLVLRPFLVLQQLVSLGVMALLLYGLTHMRRDARLAVSTRIILIGFAVGCGFVFRGYVQPRPLGDARVVVEGGAPVQGRFIAVADNSWYVSVRPDVIAAVGEKHVVTARLVSFERRRALAHRTLPDLLR